MLKISYAGCLGLSPAISAHFTLEMCVQSENAKKLSIFFYFKGSRSFKVIDVDISRKLVAKACYGKHHVYVKRTNSSKITPFRESAPLSPFLWIPPLPSGMTYFVTKY